MKSFILLNVFLMLFISLNAQEKPAYKLFDNEGRELSYSNLLEAANKHQIILFGELHNNPISHWLQLELSKDLHEKAGNSLILGAEMMEADNQLIIDEYLADRFPYRNFKADARLWNNFDTDYKPLLDLAKEQNLPFIATNVPRRYASIVNRLGFEGLKDLSEEAKKYIAPLPVKYDPELPGYKKMLEMAGNMPGKQSNENFPKAQAIKDATMAYFIHQNLNNNQIFIHFHGAFHSDYYDGIYWYLKQYNPQYKILTISTVEQKDIGTLDADNFGKADFIICVPEHMTKTY